jgi:hypothetical protein
MTSAADDRADDTEEDEYDADEGFVKKRRELRAYMNTLSNRRRIYCRMETAAEDSRL